MRAIDNFARLAFHAKLGVAKHKGVVVITGSSVNALESARECISAGQTHLNPQ